MKFELLDKINSSEDLKKIPFDKLEQVSNEIRDFIINTLSETGGHFASNLGVVELSVALHYVLNTPEDKLIWDVGHQTYPHKILTGRKDRLSTIRHFGGLAGFPKREESPFDLYNTGHAGTSISQLVGEAVARDVKGEKHKCVCVIGDASIASGMAFEGMNHAGHLQSDMIVILNDNDMSISKNVGALNRYLNRLITSPIYNNWRRFWYSLVMWIPVIGPALQLFSKRLEKSAKDLLTQGSLFTDFGFRYIGPVDGHNITSLVTMLQKALVMKGPILMHVYTQKGKGFKPAETDPVLYHSVGLFDPENGIRGERTQTNTISYSDIVGDTLIELAENNNKIVVITPAMIEGSGLRKFAEKFPERIYDVGIAEQHAAAFSGALAASGLIPYLCIYSTFLTRGLDQVIQDIALMNLPVRIVIDRAGCVGPDGETHQGLFDLGYLLAIPGIKVFAPSSGSELREILKVMEKEISGPVAVRFPKAQERIDTVFNESCKSALSITPEIYGNGEDIAIITIGNMLSTGLEVARVLEKYSITSRVAAVRWIRPIDLETLNEVLSGVKRFIFIEESYIHASASSYILMNLNPANLSRYILTFAFPEEAIIHGERSKILHEYGLSPEAVSDYLLQNVFQKKKFTHSRP